MHDHYGLFSTLRKVFTPSEPAIANYQSRADDERFRRHLNESGLQIIVFGASGVGKTSMVESLLQKHQRTYFRFRFTEEVTRDNVWAMILERMGFRQVATETITLENSASNEVRGGLIAMELIEFKGRKETAATQSVEQVTISYHDRPMIQDVVEILYRLDCVLFLDDIEQIQDEGIRRLISDLGKSMSDEAPHHPDKLARVIYSGAGQEVERLLWLKGSLRTRLADLKLNPLPTVKIEAILKDGWRELGIDHAAVDVPRVAFLCGGFARYAHRIGKSAAEIAFGQGTNVLIEGIVKQALQDTVETFRDMYQSIFDTATGHNAGGMRLREKILFVMAETDEIDVPFDFIVKRTSELCGKPIKPNALSGPLGELKKDEREQVLEDGRRQGTHRYRDLLFKVFVRILREESLRR